MTIIRKKIRLPDGYEDVDGYIYKNNTSKKKKLVNATVEAVGRKNVTDRVKNTTKSYVSVEFSAQSLGKKETREYEVNMICSGKFIDDLPDFVIIEPGCVSKTKEIFYWIIQNGMQNLPIESLVRHPFGWDEKRFYWENGTTIVSADMEYQIAAEASILLKFEFDPLIAVFLGSVHGPLGGFLVEAGITHNFTTDIYGESGIGKTDLTRLCVNNVTGKAYALASGRKDLMIKIKEEKDATLVLDDYNKAESVRTKERIQQTVSEIIQMTCDSAILLMDGYETKENFVHVIINREERFINISTINRTFSVEMGERLPLEQYNKMKDFSGRKMMFFTYFLIRFIESNYDELSTKVKSDYDIFLNDTRDKYQNRIASTIAVQKILKKILISYYKYIGFDERCVQQLDSVLENSVNKVGREMCGLIQSIRNEANRKKALPLLAEILRDLGNGYKLSENEEKYWKEKDAIKRKKVIGFCANEGYLSFDMKSMLSLLNSCENAQGPISNLLLSKELHAYGLAYVDNEKKLCSRFGTKRRMYHVHVQRLLELCPSGYESIMDMDLVIHTVVRRFTPEE